MGDKTGIQWTDATWNPVVGCSIVSPGCTNCYAMKWAHKRLDGFAAHYSGTTKAVNGNAVWTGKVEIAPDDILRAPLRWKKPRRIFVNSMGDLFHESVPIDWIDHVVAIMALSPDHTFQVLTKRSAVMREYFSGDWKRRIEPIMDEIRPFKLGRHIFMGEHLSNCWLGVSVEDQARADQRIPDLLATPAAIRFLSCEPLLGDLNLAGAMNNCRCGECDYCREVADHPTRKIDWVIVGGESGPGSRPMYPAWARSIRDQCWDAGVPFLFKQWGDLAPAEKVRFGESGECWRRWPDGRETWFLDEIGLPEVPDVRFSAVGKKKAGRLLDGQEWNEFPEVRG